jgi:hypothetical protein
MKINDIVAPHHRKPNRRSVPIDVRYQNYEMLKQKLASAARTPAEYDAACREAARRAGV